MTTDITDRATKNVTDAVTKRFDDYMARGYTTVNAACAALDIGERRPLSEPDKARLKDFLDSCDTYSVTLMLNQAATELEQTPDNRTITGIMEAHLTTVAVQHDPVNHPSHYTQYKGMEIIDLTEQMNFNLGNAVKYITRAGFKDPDKTLEDLKKSVWYIKREMERLTRND